MLMVFPYQKKSIFFPVLLPRETTSGFAFILLNSELPCVSANVLFQPADL